MPATGELTADVRAAALANWLTVWSRTNSLWEAVLIGVAVVGV
jgi:hypothetical protein